MCRNEVWEWRVAELHLTSVTGSYHEEWEYWRGWCVWLGERGVIQMNNRDRDVEGFVNEANAVIKENVELPAGYSYKWTGQYENQQRAKTRLAMVIPVVFLLMTFLLYMAFKSWSDAVLILITIPFLLVGGIVAMLITGTFFTVAVGYITLGGIALENGVIMVTYIKQLREKLP